LVELAGYPTIYVDEVDVQQKGIFITAPVNGEWRPHLDNHMNEPRGAHLIHWLLERPSSSDGSVGSFARKNRKLIDDRYFDEVWVSDRRLAQETALRHVVLGSDYGLGEPGDGKHFDFVHMSYIVPRREHIYKHFMNIGPNCWGDERHKVLQASRFAVNVHQDQFPFCEPLRLALFAAYGLPVITESLYDSHPYGDHLIHSSYDDLPKTIRETVKQPYKKYKQKGLEFQKLMCEEYNFKKMIEEAIYVNGLQWR
jgi:hypothetical protein